MDEYNYVLQAQHDRLPTGTLAMCSGQLPGHSNVVHISPFVLKDEPGVFAVRRCTSIVKTKIIASQQID